MSRSLAHRGPDDTGYLACELKGSQRSHESRDIPEEKIYHGYNGLLFLGHRRLSIIDLSEAGHQPMCNEDGSIWIIFNGEIYNYKELAESLVKKGHQFKSRTDTEVILHAYEEWGEECFNHFNGMWAFALWDKDKQELFCARDRFGIKPFYYYFDRRTFILASEIKAILQDRNVERLPNDDLVYDYLGYGCIDHSRETFFRNIWQLRGAHYLTLEIRKSDSLVPNVSRYWDLELGRREVQGDWKGEFLNLLEDSIRLHMRSDVPVGTCLSGGLDSSTIVCLARKLLGSNIHKTFSSCFDDEEYDERAFIEKVVETTGAENHCVFPQGEELFGEIENLIWHQDEPFGSTSVYAQWHVFKLASLNRTKVILDGQGADELLAGYHPFLGYYLSELARTLQGRLFSEEYRRIRLLYRYSHFWIMSHVLVSLLPRPWSRILRRHYLASHAHWLKADRYSPIRVTPGRKFNNVLFDQLYHSLMNVSLPGLLHYEDRNSMAHSIEARVPFLDYRLAEFIFSLPMHQLIRNGTTKVILREAMQGILPEQVRTRRDKMGFVTPQDIWLRLILKDRVMEILKSRKFAERGYFDIGHSQRTFLDYCDGRIEAGPVIWRWVNLELWFRRFIDRNSHNVG